MKEDRIIEGNLMATKSSSEFGGVNMWNLWVTTKSGRWEEVQWMSLSRIQNFFKTKLPEYKEVGEVRVERI